jgi:hypothetical protein
MSTVIARAEQYTVCGWLTSAGRNLGETPIMFTVRRREPCRHIGVGVLATTSKKALRFFAVCKPAICLLERHAKCPTLSTSAAGILPAVCACVARRRCLNFCDVDFGRGGVESLNLPGRVMPHEAVHASQYVYIQTLAQWTCE